LLLVIGATGIFGIVTLSALAAENAFAARELQTEVDELSYRYDELTAEVAGLETPERIRQVAGSELGMVPAEQPGYLVLRDQGNDAADRDQHQERDLLADGEGVVSDPVKHARDTAHLTRGADEESEG
jgi:cell division protein FtsL